MRQKAKKRLYVLELNYPNNMSRIVKVKASSREVAIDRALKRNRGAQSVRPLNG